MDHQDNPNLTPRSRLQEDAKPLTLIEDSEEVKVNAEGKIKKKRSVSQWFVLAGILVMSISWPSATVKTNTPSLKGAIAAATQDKATTTNVTVYLTEPGNAADSIFYTRTLERYGSGRVRYNIHQAFGGCNCANTTTPSLPCLAAKKPNGIGRPGACKNFENLKCTYPKCKTVITNDEFCGKNLSNMFDIREYYTADSPNMPYIPLGPRIDSWASFSRIKRQQGDAFTILPASKRKYAFNAIFSQSTNGARGRLARIIEGHDNSQWSIYAKMAKRWVKDVNHHKSREHANTDEYMQVVLDSTFTLAPTGHNPECFRLFEAIEAGSIPVFARDEHYDKHPCKDSLHVWLDGDNPAPMIVLKSWDELYPTIEQLLKDPAALDMRQAKLREWYEKYMREVTTAIETFLLAGV